MEAQAEGLDFNQTQVVGGCMFQTLDIARRETDLQTANETHDHAVAFRIIMRVFRSRTTEACRPTSPGRLELLKG